jgi:hypothetical protein
MSVEGDNESSLVARHARRQRATSFCQLSRTRSRASSKACSMRFMKDTFCVSRCASLQIELTLPRGSVPCPASRHDCKMSAKVSVNHVSHVSPNLGVAAVTRQQRKGKSTTWI